VDVLFQVALFEIFFDIFRTELKYVKRMRKRVEITGIAAALVNFMRISVNFCRRKKRKR
jgi:hypothetical protein